MSGDTIEDVIRIKAAACRVLEVSDDEFFSRSRKPRIVLARWITSALARQLTQASYPQIARAMKRPTHGTIHEGCRRLFERMGEGAKLDRVPFSDWLARVQSEICQQPVYVLRIDGQAHRSKFGGDVIMLDRNVQICPECKGQLYLHVQEWREDGIPECIELDCENEPDPDDKDYELKAHRWFQSDWMPAYDRVLAWACRRVRVVEISAPSLEGVPA